MPEALKSGELHVSKQATYDQSLTGLSIQLSRLNSLIVPTRPDEPYVQYFVDRPRNLSYPSVSKDITNKCVASPVAIFKYYNVLRSSMQGVLRPSDKDTAAHLESLVVDIIEPINSRAIETDDNAGGWANMASDFSLVADTVHTKSKHESLQFVRWTCKQMPVWSNYIKSMSTQIDAASANVFVDLEADGQHEGVTKSVLLVFEFKSNSAGEWKATSVNTLTGHGMDSVPGWT